MTLGGDHRQRRTQPKNHHGAGTFGCHLRAFELLRSDGSRRVCSPVENADWFAATIGGLGLTGLITWAEIALRAVASVAIAVDNARFDGLDEFLPLNDAAEATHEYTVAWIDLPGGAAARRLHGR